MLSPVGSDGHDVIDFWGSWRQVADAYLTRLGFPPPVAKGAPPPTHFASIGDISKIPFVGDGGRKGYQGFLDRDLPRAFAISTRGDWAYRSGENAISEALKACNDMADCQLYAVGTPRFRCCKALQDQHEERRVDPHRGEKRTLKFSTPCSDHSLDLLHLAHLVAP
jgi:hypothetical protein